MANYFVSERTPEATRDAYLYAVAIPTLFLAFGLNHAWAFLWAQEHGEYWLFHAHLHTYKSISEVIVMSFIM